MAVAARGLQRHTLDARSTDSAVDDPRFMSMTIRARSASWPRSIARSALLSHALLLFVASAPAQNASVARPLLAEPSLSSDASEIVFTSGGDIWSVPARGGEARLLVSHPAYEYRPLLSPDGQELAFASTRTGAGDIYVLTLRTGAIRRLTFDEIPEHPDAWSSDGQWIYFSLSSHDISGMLDVHRVRASGGTPMPVAADRYATEYWAAPGADGKTVAITARGTTAGQWWRHGHSHLDESEIWLVHDGATPRYEGLVTGDGAKRLWPMWGSDGRTLYYMSDEGGAENIWKRHPDGRRERLTSYRDGRVVWPQIARTGSAIVFERDYRIHLLDVPSGTPREVPITLRGAPAAPGVERLTVNNAQLQEAALSPDGRKVAYIVRGEIFAASAKDGGDGFRVTRTAAREVQMEWSPDSRRLAYVSDRDGVGAVYMYDFGTNTESSNAAAASW
jgi:Tol biopolymer transport system component